MTFPPNRTRFIFPAFLSVAFLTSFAVHSLDAQTDALPGGAVHIGSTISLNSSATIDSFDSTDPSKSTNGLYDASKRQLNGNVFINYNNKSDLRNAFVYGNLTYSGFPVKNTDNVQGVIATPFDGTSHPVNDPVWADGSFQQYTGGANPPGGGGIVVSGTVTNPTLIKVVGDFNVPGGTSFSIVADTFVDRYVTVWVTGKLTTSGSGHMTQDPWVHVTWIVDKDIVTGGDYYENQSGKAANLRLLPVGDGKVNLTGASSFIASIDAPLRNVNISGAGLSGDITANVLALSGSSAVHCDESLTPDASFRIAFEGQPPATDYSVNQYVESAVQFTGRPDLAHNGGSLSNYPDNGTGYLQSAYHITFQDVFGRSLNLKALDIAEYSTVYAFPTSITFIGSKADGSTISQTFVTDGQCDGMGPLADFQTLIFGDEWSGLLRIDIQSDYGLSIDNVVLQR